MGSTQVPDDRDGQRNRKQQYMASNHTTLDSLDTNMMPFTKVTFASPVISNKRERQGFTQLQ